MRLSTEQFIEQATNGKPLAPLIVIHGAEPLAALEAADAVRALAKTQGFIEREVFTAESGFDWGSLRAASNALSLFATQRMIELRIPTGKPGREGSTAIEEYCQRLPDDTVTLVTLPEIDWQGKQTKWFVALEGTALTIEAMPVERAKLPQWLAARLRRQQQSANPEALDFLADRVEGNLLAAKQEVEKLGLLCAPGDIPLAVIEASVANVSRFSPFHLTSAIVDADAARLQRMLDGLRAEGEAPPLILWVLTNELRQIMRATNVTKSGRPAHPSKARDVEKLARKHSAGSLTRLSLLAAQIDRMIKGVNGNDPWDALFQLGCGIAGVKLVVSMPVTS